MRTLAIAASRSECAEEIPAAFEGGQSMMHGVDIHLDGVFEAVIADVCKFEDILPWREHNKSLEVTTCYRPRLLGKRLGVVGTFSSDMDVTAFSDGKRKGTCNQEAAL